MQETVAIVQENAASAEEFLRLLSPQRQEFDPPRPGESSPFLFRGVGDSEYPLTPLAFRPPHLQADVRKQIDFERRHLRLYMEAVDRQGLPIPNDTEDLRQSLDGMLQNEEWPPRVIWPLAALAQHYGIPTRFLDWTRRAYVAAYFAATSALQMNAADTVAPGSDHLAVVSLDTSHPVWKLVATPRRFLVRLCDRVDVPTAGIPNLRAQQGVLTLSRFEGSGLYEGLPFRPLPLEQAMNEQLSNRIVAPYAMLGQQTASDPFKRYLLPKREARSLLKLLAREQVSAEFLFPGFEGAAKAVRELVGLDAVRTAPVYDGQEQQI